MAATEAKTDQIQCHEQLIVWQRARDLVVAVYSLVQRLPASERFGLSEQLRRAAVSVIANIAERHGRLHRGDFLRQLSIAKGSLAELRTLLSVALHLDLLTQRELGRSLGLADEVSRMLTAMVRALRAADR